MNFLPSLWITIPLLASSLIWIILLIVPTQPFSDTLWEIIPTPNSSGDIMRTPVPHGWIVTYKRLARSIVYIPDEKHEWKIK